jgi:hypothetical protein
MTIAHNDPQFPPEHLSTTSVCICPTCGHQHSPYSAVASSLLDLLDVAKSAIVDAKAIVESEVLP